MASIAFEEYKNKLNNLRPALDDLGGALHLDEARNEVEKLEEESAQDGFWNDTENSQRVQKRIKTLKAQARALRQAHRRMGGYADHVRDGRRGGRRLDAARPRERVPVL